MQQVEVAGKSGDLLSCDRLVKSYRRLDDCGDQKRIDTLFMLQRSEIWPKEDLAKARAMAKSQDALAKETQAWLEAQRKEDESLTLKDRSLAYASVVGALFSVLGAALGVHQALSGSASFPLLINAVLGAACFFPVGWMIALVPATSVAMDEVAKQRRAVLERHEARKRSILGRD